MPVSVIIPTLNEEACLAETLRAVQAQHPHEIIVVDGGSTDRTAQAASEADLFLSGPSGRAVQMNLGATHATGNVFLFLHADCVLEDGALQEAERRLRRPGVAAGCFRLTVRAHGWLYRLVNVCATARVRLTGIAYGDQGLFVTRDTFHRCRGFPETRLMEDWFFCRRLQKLGRIVVARQRIFTSPRRWERMGLARQTLRNWGLAALTAAGVPPNDLARFYPAIR